jgi:hypothetical protein
VKEHDDEVVVVVVVEPEVVDDGVPPVREAFTFAIVVLSAPNDERSERIDWTCAELKAAACAIGASESIDVAIASPVATAATFAIAFVVTVCITIVNYFKTHMLIKLSSHTSRTLRTFTFTLPHSARYRPVRHGLVGKD